MYPEKNVKLDKMQQGDKRYTWYWIIIIILIIIGIILKFYRG